jgi:uncharacterized protein YjiS (DUF1127 family)
MILSHVIHALRLWRRYRACVHELSELSDIELADIGVTRSGIPSVAWRVSRVDPASPASASRAGAFDDR